MADEGLLSRVGDYPTGVLSCVAPDGYPVSVRCAVRWREGTRRITFAPLPGIAADWRGRACLLFHMHDERLENLRQMVFKGELIAADDGTLEFAIGDVVTANGRSGTDRMPHATAPLHMLQFYRLGRRKAREYLRTRGAPWPQIPFDDITRAVNES